MRTVEQIDVDIARVAVETADRRQAHSDALAKVAAIEQAIQSGDVGYTASDLAEAREAEQFQRLGLDATRPRAQALAEERRTVERETFKAEVPEVLRGKGAVVDAALEHVRDALAQYVEAVADERLVLRYFEQRAQELERPGDPTLQAPGIARAALQVGGTAFHRRRDFDTRLREAVEKALADARI